MKVSEIRSLFLRYFEGKGHEIVSSSSLIPGNDPTLLFTNAGMVQFKDVFLGQDQRPYVRAASSQRCVRAGGKHNDLENVGFTARHHTFFEMLGNFSFGDYFKREAIHYAWSFLTDVLKLPKEKLWVTVFRDDLEAESIWINEIGIDKNRLSRCGEKDNFWMMGDVGPCGPCTEIFYDHGSDIPGGPPGSPEADGDRYIEIWNLVFMQYSRDAQGNLTPLPKPSVDTGMGLERISAVMQGVHNNYDIDLFQGLIADIKKLLSVCENTATLNSLRVIADHIRSTAFLISDGVLPGNEGRGYVLRRIIRRAVRHGHRLGARAAFLYRLVGSLAREMGDVYPDLARQQVHIEKTLLAEEEQFARTLDNGLKILEQDIHSLSGKIISGETVFRLYDTYGFPVDLTADIAREQGLVIDEEGFKSCMSVQQQQSRASNQFSSQALLKKGLNVTVETVFTGYQELKTQAIVTALYNEAGEAVDSLSAGAGIVVLDKTPFYAESGGQVGDQGVLVFEGGYFEVVDTQKEKNAILHLGNLLSGTLSLGVTVTATVSEQARKSTALNHSATHLLHAALKKILGDHVQQKGSLVDSERLRFDFLHGAPLSAEQMRGVEHLVNQQVRENHSVTTDLLSLEEAKKSGALALFGEKYSDEVRVLSMGSFSKELCGGTHVRSTGEIGLFKILSETGVASGVRRIEAVTGWHATQFVEQQQRHLQAIAELLKTDNDSVAEKVMQLLDRAKSLEKEMGRMQAILIAGQSEQMLAEAVDLGGIKLFIKAFDAADIKNLRELADQLKNKLGSAIILLASTLGDKVSLITAVTPDVIGRVKASDLADFVAKQLGGKGGGRPDLAQAGGIDVKALPAALTSVKVWVEAKL